MFVESIRWSPMVDSSIGNAESGQMTKYTWANLNQSQNPFSCTIFILWELKVSLFFKTVKEAKEA